MHGLEVLAVQEHSEHKSRLLGLLPLHGIDERLLRAQLRTAVLRGVLHRAVLGGGGGGGGGGGVGRACAVKQRRQARVLGQAARDDGMRRRSRSRGRGRRAAAAIPAATGCALGGREHVAHGHQHPGAGPGNDAGTGALTRRRWRA